MTIISTPNGDVHFESEDNTVEIDVANTAWSHGESVVVGVSNWPYGRYDEHGERAPEGDATVALSVDEFKALALAMANAADRL